MLPDKSSLLTALALALSFSAALAQSPKDAKEIVQQVVDNERAENKKDHSQWIYLEDSKKPKEHVLQWVASTSKGGVRRVLQRDGQPLPEDKQRQLIDQFLRDTHAQDKEAAENRHDAQQVDDFLKLLPTAFVWTQTSATDGSTMLHFEPDPKFHPPTREARVFSSMAGDLVADDKTHRIHRMSGRLIHDVTFGGGLLGKLKQGSSFALDQEPVGSDYWELTSIRVHLTGNALLFKSVSLEQDQERAHFQPEADDVTLQQAATAVLKQPQDAKLLRTEADDATPVQKRGAAAKADGR